MQLRDTPIAELYRRHRRPTLPSFSLRRRQVGRPVVYVICPDSNRPAGGIRTLYRHVDLLNSAGISAYIVHRRRDFRCSWFDNATSVISRRRLEVGQSDVVAIPEIYGQDILKLPVGIRTVIVNQGVYLSFGDRGFSAGPSPYTDRPEVEGVVVVSDDSRRYLSYVYPSLRMAVVPNSIDRSIFYPSRVVAPKNIAFMPRRGRGDAIQVIQILLARGSLDGWSINPIDSASAREVALRLRESAIFLTFGYQEGFGLPIAEAMASGCVVVGYHGQGGREVLLPEHSWPVEPGNVYEFCRSVEEVMQLYERNIRRFNYARRMAMHYVGARYSVERQSAALIGFYGGLLGRVQPQKGRFTDLGH